MPNQKHLTLILRWNLALAFAEGLLVLWSYIREPSEPGAAVLLGFSYSRLALILLVLVLLSAITILLFRSFRNSGQIQATDKFLARLANQKGVIWISILWLTIVYGLLFLSDHQLGPLASYRERLVPSLLWLAVLAVQLLLFVVYIRGIDPEVFREQRAVFRASLVLLILFGLLTLGISLTRIGLMPDNVYWQGPGTPVLLQQVFLALLAGGLLHLLITHTSFGRSTRLDVLVFLALWAVACLLWLSQPAKLTYFSLAPREPNFQIYPFSDALIYDSTAQEFLIGKPIPGDFWVKPLYSLFLAFLHLLSGNNYALLTALQVVILAIIPSFVYLLTTYLDRRSAGLIAALLIILRERNAIALSNVIRVSHSKLLLSDVFAMGAMIILVWLVIWWLQRPAERRAAPVAVGGMLGLLVLTRGHPVLMIPFIFLVSLIVLKPDLKLWFDSSLRITLGLALVLLPWFWHTYQFTGRLAFQDPSSPYATNDTLVKLYTQSSNSVGAPNPSYEEFQARAFKSVLEHPLEITYFTFSHYFHNTIFSYLYLPHSFQLENASTYVKRLPFWGRWEGSIPAESRVLMLLNLTVLALGISTAWKKTNKVVLAPFILGAAYNLSIAVVRRSGWRFILPADWITLVFYAIGLVQIIAIVQSLVNKRSEQPDSSELLISQPFVPMPQWRSAVTFGLPFLLIALGLVLGHRLFPSVSSAKSTREELLQEYESTVAEPEWAAMEKFLYNEGIVVLHGKALYPVYFEADDGMGNFNWASFEAQSYPRLAFYLIGPRSISVNLPMDVPPTSFPAGAEVIVIGCQSEADDINAVAVLVRDAEPVHYLTEPFPPSICPSSAP